MASPYRIKRLAADLRMRRRRLAVYRRSPPWPGKEPALRFELSRYDHFLLVAAEMLEVPGVDVTTPCPMSPEARAVLEDRLAVAGLDVMAPPSSTGDVFEDGELSP